MGTKEATLEGLVDAATRLFLQQGLGAVPMEDVAQVAGCTRRTLYRYFATKEELALAVVTAVLERWNGEQTALALRLQGTGAERLTEFLQTLSGQVEFRRAELRLLAEFDFLFRDTAPYLPPPETAARFRAVLPVTENLIDAMLVQGERDGSLRLPCERRVLVPTITTALWSLAQRVALRDHRLHEEYGVAGGELVATQVALLLLSLKTPQGATP